MASSRRLPTSYNTATYGGGGLGRDYTALATWEAATDNDLVTATKGEVLECYDDAASFDDSVIVGGATTSSSYFRVIKPADGEGHDGTPNNGVTFVSSSVVYMMQIAENYAQFQDLIGINSTLDGDAYAFLIFNNNPTGAACVGCIGKANGFGMGSGSGNPSYFINCLVYEGGGFRSEYTAHRFYNCTSVDNSYGFYSSGVLGILKNCCVCDSGTADYNGTWTKTTCYEGDATVFANQASDDYHLAASDTTCRGEGTDLSADATYAFDDDIDGGTRSAWDIGADEYAASGWTGKIWGVTNPAKIWGIEVANIAKVCGVE